MISILSLISNSSSLFSKSLGIISSVLITIDITATFIFYSFFSSLIKSKYLFILFFSFILICGLLEQQNQLDDKFFSSF